MAQIGAAARTDTEIIHASTVALNNQGALIVGASGRGKSGLALQLMAWGAKLVSDDKTLVTKNSEGLIASVPESISGQIEARGTGILAAPVAGPTPLRLIVDLDHEEHDRLPLMREREIIGVPLPLVYKSPHDHFPAAILLYLKGERIA